ncbi:glycine cleavage system protein GcvH [bacterium]|nr:glycine cleavage system protein GcvH [bacterium]
MNVPQDLRYTEEHEWIKVDGDEVTIGITDFAQSELGDIVFMEFPEIGQQVSQSESFGSIEAVKAVEEVFAPVSGEVVAINTELEDDFQIVNSDPYGAGWMIKIKISAPAELDALMTPEVYTERIAE